MANLGRAIASHISIIRITLIYIQYIMRNQRRIGEAFMITSGIGVAAAGASLGVMPLWRISYCWIGNIFSILGLVMHNINLIN
jgi:hypothetical protein